MLPFDDISLRNAIGTVHPQTAFVIGECANSKRIVMIRYPGYEANTCGST